MTVREEVAPPVMDERSSMDARRRKVHVATLSVCSNICLVIAKLVIGIVTGSISILSEAAHSASDLLAAFIALFSVETSSQPADLKHPFGHGKIENISGALEALLIFLAAIWIIYAATKKLVNPEPLMAVGWGVAVMLFSSLVNILVSERLFKVGRETDSIALQADAWHLRTDVYTSAGVMVSLTLMWIGYTFSPGLDLNWIDPIIAIIVAFVIIKAAYDLLVQSTGGLIDVRLPEEEERWIDQLIREHTPDVHGFHQLRTRKAGPFRFVEFHMKVDPEMSVERSHGITHEISQKIKEHFPAASITIHTEPCDGNCVDRCLEGCLLPVKGDINSKIPLS